MTTYINKGIIKILLLIVDALCIHNKINFSASNSVQISKSQILILEIVEYMFNLSSVQRAYGTIDSCGWQKVRDQSMPLII